MRDTSKKVRSNVQSKLRQHASSILSDFGLPLEDIQPTVIKNDEMRRSYLAFQRLMGYNMVVDKYDLNPPITRSLDPNVTGPPSWFRSPAIIKESTICYLD